MKRRDRMMKHLDQDIRRAHGDRDPEDNIERGMSPAPCGHAQVRAIQGGSGKTHGLLHSRAPRAIQVGPVVALRYE
jgi:hypothetical protein